MARMLLSLCWIILILAGCSSHKLFIVRHAEKSDAPKGDPVLTESGRDRAAELARILKPESIRAIYSTQTQRTRQTAEPLASATGLPIQSYGNESLGFFIRSVASSGKNTLVVGHSNSVLQMLDSLGLAHKIRQIPDGDYDNLFEIAVRGKGTGSKFRLRERLYGRPTEDSSGQKMSR